jgi:hypothetical protein
VWCGGGVRVKERKRKRRGKVSASPWKYREKERKAVLFTLFDGLVHGTK